MHCAHMKVCVHMSHTHTHTNQQHMPRFTHFSISSDSRQAELRDLPHTPSPHIPANHNARLGKQTATAALPHFSKSTLVGYERLSEAKLNTEPWTHKPQCEGRSEGDKESKQWQTTKVSKPLLGFRKKCYSLNKLNDTSRWKIWLIY